MLKGTVHDLSGPQNDVSHCVKAFDHWCHSIMFIVKRGFSNLFFVFNLKNAAKPIPFQCLLDLTPFVRGSKLGVGGKLTPIDRLAVSISGSELHQEPVSSRQDERERLTLQILVEEVQDGLVSLLVLLQYFLVLKVTSCRY